MSPEQEEQDFNPSHDHATKAAGNKKQLHTNIFQKFPAYKEFFSSNTDLIYSKCFADFREILVQVNKSCLRKKKQ